MDVDCVNCLAIGRLSTWTAFNDLTMTSRCTTRRDRQARDADAMDADTFDLIAGLNHR